MRRPPVPPACAEPLRPSGPAAAARAAACALLLALIGPGCALQAPPGAPALDDADPVQINEAALRAAARADIDHAWLLLERAARLAPHDARIAANLAALRAYRGTAPRGRVVPGLTPTGASGGAIASGGAAASGAAVPSGGAVMGGGVAGRGAATPARVDVTAEPAPIWSKR